MRPRLERVRRALSWHRRLVAGVLAAAAAATAVAAARPPVPPAEEVLVTAHAVDGGATLVAGDVRVAALPAGSAPDGALRPGARVAGRVLAGPARAGEPLTDVRLVRPPLLRTYAARGLVGAPVRLADPQVAGLLATGDLVDVLAAQPSEAALAGGGVDSGAELVASGARVLSVPQPGQEGVLAHPGDGGALVLLATTPEEAARLAAAEAGARLSVVLRAG